MKDSVFSNQVLPPYVVSLSSIVPLDHRKKKMKKKRKRETLNNIVKNRLLHGRVIDIRTNANRNFFSNVKDSCLVDYHVSPPP